MSSEMFNLTWSDFEQCTSNSFKDLYSQKEFVDVTIVSEDDKEIKAHKVVLGACSSIFKNILVRNPHQHPLIYLSGIRYEELKSMINFMYLGQTEIAQENLESFMNAATRFQVKGLTDQNVPKSPGAEVSKVDMKNQAYIAHPLNTSEIIIDDEIIENMNEEGNEGNYYGNSLYVDENVDFKPREETLDGEFKCNHCDYRAKQKCHLKPHIRAKHEGVKFICDMCDYKSSYSHHLNLHKRNKHTMA